MYMTLSEFCVCIPEANIGRQLPGEWMTAFQSGADMSLTGSNKRLYK